MARALVVLACAAAAAATRYVDYAGGKMPQYGAGAGGDYEAAGELAPHSDDYHGHSPDAPASLDYKYQEEWNSNTDKPSKNVDDAEVWRKVRRKERGLHRHEEHADMDSAGFIEDDEEVPRVRDRSGHGHSHGHVKRRPRLKGADDARPPLQLPPPPHRRSAKYSRDKKIEVSDTRDLDRDDFSDDKSTAFEEDSGFVSRDTTRRVRRRKPRDRAINFDDDLNTDEDVLVANRRMKSDDDKELDYSAAEASSGRRRPPDERGFQRERERYRPVIDDDDAAKVRSSKQRQKISDDYDDYYDMKRVQSIRQKLPMLLRRASTSTVNAPTKFPDETELLHKLWASRRLGEQPSAPAASAGLDSELDSESDSGEVLNIPTETGSAATKAPTATTLGNTNTTISTLPMAVALTVTPQELSLAEKSRLSILKKVQRKDGVKDKSTKKPAVLLQVTQKLATVVMVEPPVSRQAWLPPHMLTGDSPERIDRVKKLMRHKLVAQAKGIQDLTDNWDEMVCDYIDVALLDSGASPPAQFSVVLFISVIIII